MGFSKTQLNTFYVDYSCSCVECRKKQQQQNMSMHGKYLPNLIVCKEEHIKVQLPLCIFIFSVCQYRIIEKMVSSHTLFIVPYVYV